MKKRRILRTVILFIPVTMNIIWLGLLSVSSYLMDAKGKIDSAPPGSFDRLMEMYHSGLRLKDKMLDFLPYIILSWIVLIVILIVENRRERKSDKRIQAHRDREDSDVGNGGQ